MFLQFIYNNGAIKNKMNKPGGLDGLRGFGMI
jgi:hypothetical protein